MSRLYAAFLMAHLDGLPHLEAVRFANKIAAHKLAVIKAVRKTPGL